MHAVIVTVDIPAGQFEVARNTLQKDAIPRVSSAPGFVKGYWTIGNDKMQGMSFVVFRTLKDAENVAKMVRTSPMPSGVSIVSVEVREVVAEAPTG
jgi:hypothetical protein